jgi:biopolymer transport protein ExbB
MADLLIMIKESIWHLGPILVAGIIAIAIVLERIRALYFNYPIRNEKAFFNRIQEMVMEGKITDAVALCERYGNKPVAQVVRKALLRAHQPDSLIENGLELAVEEAIQKVQKRTPYLATIANVSTLLGLLGTIGGLIHSFNAISGADAAQRTAMLAKGISEAMNATMFGLAVAIPCMVLFSFLVNKTNSLVSDIEASAVRTFDIIKQRYFLAETKAIKANQLRPVNPGFQNRG